MNLAAASGMVWTVSAAAVLVFNFWDLVGKPMSSDPSYTSAMLDYVLNISVGRAWAWMIRAQLAKAEAELRGLVAENPSDDWAQHALGRVLERQGRGAEGLPHLRLAAAMSGDPEHEVAVLRVERQVRGL